MKLQDVPDKVFAEKLFQYLDWNDLLRLRRVCSWTKKITDEYLKANPDLAPELEINEEKGKCFGAFLEMGIPTTKLFINNSTLGYRFYEDDKMDQFLEDYGPLIKDLRVTQITLANDAVCRDKELTFMEGLPNMTSLDVAYCTSGKTEVGKLKSSKLKSKPPKDSEMAASLKLPATFKNLEQVKIGLDPQNTDLAMKERKKRTRDFLMQCPRLKWISFPICWLDQTPKGTECASGTLPGDLHFLLLSFMERPNKFGFEIKAEAGLEWIDFENCHEGYGEWLKDEWKYSLPFNWTASLYFLELCNKTNKDGIKLGNVSPYWYYAKDSPNLDGTKADNVGIGEPVVSLVGLDEIIMDVDMPNLQKITIPSTKFCGAGGKRANWPSLKILDITVDGTQGNCWNFVGATNFKQVKGTRVQETDNVLDFLFCNVDRSSVTELYLKYKEDDGKVNSNSAVPKPLDMEEFLKKKGKVKWGKQDKLSVPNTMMIVKSCRNLKVLKLGNWQGTNEALLTFWNGLAETLEEVEFENCGNVGDFTFFGEDEDKPDFLKLKNLKKLSLKGMDKMSKVTDLLFIRILSQMKLKQLVLTSEKPLEKITKDGIASLLEGPFAESIEQFPFQGWSLASVTPKEFEEMKKKFRSYNMF